MTFAEVVAATAAEGLSVVGAFHADPADGAGDCVTVVLLGPVGERMWSAFRASPEALDDGANPLDRWSERVISRLAAQLGAQAFFPFGGPPWLPFQKWAERGEDARVSPVAMQVTPGRGLWASYRGALGFSDALALPAVDDCDPCAGCLRPCLDACPVAAFADGRYDVPKCCAHLKTPAGAACLDGCLVRCACPAGAAVGLPKEQRAFHMAAFLKANGSARELPE